MKVNCDYCGKEMDKCPSAFHGEHHFCSRTHCMKYQWEHGNVGKVGGKKKETPLKLEYGRNKIPSPCYRKEARAMLQGKNTKGKNHCVELPETCL